MLVERSVPIWLKQAVAWGYLVLACAGCGWLADSDRIVVAKLDGNPIRRADINKLLRDMQPEERPNISTRGDLLRVLNTYIDDKVKADLAKQLEGEGKINVPREFAARQFDAMYPKYKIAMEQGRTMDPPLSDAEIMYYEQEREARIDQLYRHIQGEAAVSFEARKEAEDGGISVSDDALREEYDLQRDTLVNPEVVEFDGIYFPTSQEGASALATGALDRLRKGEQVGALATEYAMAGTGFPLRAPIRKDPATMPKFGPFWEKASDARVGDVIGPIFIRGWGGTQTNAQGQVSEVQIPDAFLVCKITQVQDATPMTFEQAKPVLLPGMLYAKMVEKLRADHGVEVYEKNLPDPAAYGSSGPRSIFDQKL